MGLSQKKLDEIALFQANIAKAKKADPKGYKKEANVIGWNNQLGGYISAAALQVCMTAILVLGKKIHKIITARYCFASTYDELIKFLENLLRIARDARNATPTVKPVLQVVTDDTLADQLEAQQAQSV
jgi:hypothetical protein